MDLEDKEATQEQRGLEISPTAALAAARAEIEGALVLAKRFPRNEKEVLVQIVNACKRPGFADDAEYVFPRGAKDVSGPSVYLAREVCRMWGNIRWGTTVVRDDAEERTIEAYAWDCQTNSRVTAQDTFKKLIYRKVKVDKKTGEETGGWIEPDERDLRELANRRGAIIERNCLLKLIPSDIVDEAIQQARITKEDKAAKDPKGELKKIMMAFSALNVNPVTLESFLGHGLETISPAEIVQLRGVYKSISEGNSTWQEYLDQAADKKPPLKKAEKAAAQPAATAPIEPEVLPPAQAPQPSSDDWENIGPPVGPVADSEEGPKFAPSPAPPPPPAAAPRSKPTAVPPPAPPPAPVEAPPAPAKQKMITQQQFADFYLDATGTHHWSKDQLKYLLGTFGYERPSQIPEAALERIIAIVHAGPPSR